MPRHARAPRFRLSFPLGLLSLSLSLSLFLSLVVHVHFKFAERTINLSFGLFKLCTCDVMTPECI